jgi:hypothetical protein
MTNSSVTGAAIDVDGGAQLAEAARGLDGVTVRDIAAAYPDGRIDKAREQQLLREAADFVWATNAPEFYQLLVGQRGWSPERYERFLADTWRRLLLAG